MILCCGEALIDMIPAPVEGSGETGFVPHAGGAVFNTAIALGRLGMQAGLLSGISTDFFGQQLCQTLERSRVDTSCLIRADRPSTLAFVHLTNGHASYSFFDENSAGRMLSIDEIPPIPDEVSAMFFGGISLASEPGADAYAALMLAEAGRRATMIDPNIRPGFIRDAARYRARLGGMIAAADIVKISDEDLDWLVPGTAPIADKLRRVGAADAALVIVTRGGQGATACLRDGAEVSVPARPVEVVDTVGAGDTFNAGVLASLSRQRVLSKPALAALQPETVRRALEFGAAVAAVTVSRAGANPPWLDELTGALHDAAFGDADGS